MSRRPAELKAPYFGWIPEGTWSFRISNREGLCGLSAAAKKCTSFAVEREPCVGLRSGQDNWRPSCQMSIPIVWEYPWRMPQYDVFISFASLDTAQAEILAGALRRAGKAPFLSSKELDAGSAFADTIREALRGSDELWVLLSPNSLSSQWVLSEWAAAWALEKPIIPILYRCSPEQLPDRLRALQCVDFHRHLELVETCVGNEFNLEGYSHEELRSAQNVLIRVAVIPKGETLFFWKYIRAGALQAQHEISGLVVEWLDDFPEMDATFQADVLRECLARRCNGVCLAAIHNEDLKLSVEDLNAAGVPVLMFDSDLSGSSYGVGCISSNNYLAGSLAGHKMAELVGYGGNVMVVRYKLGSQSTLDRERGFDDAIRNYRHIRIVETSRLTGEPRFVERSTKASAARCCNDIQGVFCSLEFSTAGMLRELTNANLIKNVALVGFDTNDEIAKGLGDGRIKALILQDPVQMGYSAVKAMRNYLLSTRPTKRKILETTEVIVATRDNIHSARVLRLLRPEITPRVRVDEARGADGSDVR